MKEMKFRIETITKKLPTLDNLRVWKKISDDTCPRCRRAIETNDHIWTCESTKSKLPDIFQEMESMLKRKINKKQTSEKTLSYLNLMKSDRHILHRNYTKGIITESEITQMQNSINKDCNNNEHRIKTDMTETIDTWLTAFYNQIWKPRCILVFENSKEEQRKKERIEKRIKRNRSQKNEKRKKTRQQIKEIKAKNMKQNKRKRTDELDELDETTELEINNNITSHKNQNIKWGRKPKKKMKLKQNYKN